MDFIKKNLMLIASAAVSILALVALVLGIMRIGGAKELMGQASRQVDGVNAVLRGVPVVDSDGGTRNLIPTREVVDQIKSLEHVYKRQEYRTLQRVLQENIGYDPESGSSKRRLLVEGVFPKAVSFAVPYQFPEAYKNGIDALLAKMEAGGAPTAAEIEQEKQQMAQEWGLFATETPAERQPARTARSPRDTGPPIPGGPMPPGPPMPGALPTGGRSAERSSELDRQATVRAWEKKAENIKIYVERSALHTIPAAERLTGDGQPPRVEDMWWAQQTLWLQEDIARAVASVNIDATNVTEAVIKQIGSIEMVEGPQSFAGLAPDKYYDIVRFRVEMVVDARRIPEFFDAMYRQGHYLMYLWNVEPGPAAGVGTSRDDRSEMYRWGANPIVRLTTWWETYLLRDFYYWGIVGYRIDEQTGKSTVILHNGTTRELEQIDQRKGLEGLMPQSLRQDLGGGVRENF